jgi:hypothetical protein
MDVITMPSITPLINQLKSDYPQFIFKESPDSYWSHDERTIYYNAGPDGVSLILHELAHGLLDHVDYKRDIELIAMEREAWDKAKELADKYNLVIDNNFIQSNLDTYRDWLHARSTCPKCSATGMQTKPNIYSCLACNNKWTVNEARTCALKRYSKKVK